MTRKSVLGRLPIDTYLLTIVGTVGLATLLPARGVGATVAADVTTGVIALLFFLYGARLSRVAVVAGLTHWRLQLAVFCFTFLLFPLLGLVVETATRPLLGPTVASGIVFLSALPSTVQSSIAFTSAARGNVPAALCSASVSNLAGVVITPVLVGLMLSTHGGFSASAVEDIALQLLVPFLLGQLARPLIGAWLERHKRLTGVVDRGSILLVVYTAFSESVVAGLWHQVDAGQLALLLAADAVLLAAVLVATTVLSRLAGFSKPDEIAIVFCGSKKSMATGLPMANILFAGRSVGLLVLPVMLFHQIQLMACAALAQRYAARRDEADLPAAVETPAELRGGA